MYGYRRLLVCPQGLNAPGQLSVFLEAPEVVYTPAMFNPTASFKVTILNQKTPGQGDYSKGMSRQHQQHTAAAPASALDSMLLALRLC
jgi:hypothetical protein